MYCYKLIVWIRYRFGLFRKLETKYGICVFKHQINLGLDFLTLFNGLQCDGHFVFHNTRYLSFFGAV